MVPRVAVVRWGSEPSAGEVKTMVSRCLELVGGLNSLVEKGETVALKPNVVTGELSGPGVTTDKNVVGSLVELLYEAGAGEVLIVEGAGYFTETSKALELSGFKELAERLGAGLVDVDSSPTVEVEVPNPLLWERIPVCRAFMEADVRVNLPVMKTHDQLVVTLGVKNLKGVIPKPMKRAFHRRGVVKSILDLSKAVPVDLTLLDALVAMEGLGPSFGPKVRLNTVMASTDIYALDVVAAKAMGFNPHELEYLAEAARAGLLDPSQTIDVVGEPLESYTYKFQPPPTGEEFAPGIRVVSKGACSACHGTIHSVLYDLEQSGRLGEAEGSVIVVGSQAQVPEGLETTPIIMGVCQAHNRGKGVYVEGCPPNNDRVLEAIRLAKAQGQKP